MGAGAQNARDLVHYQAVSIPLEYATQVLDKNHTGLISIQQITKDPCINDLYWCHLLLCITFCALIIPKS